MLISKPGVTVIIRDFYLRPATAVNAEPFSLLEARCRSVAALDIIPIESLPVVVGASVVGGV